MIRKIALAAGLAALTAPALAQDVDMMMEGLTMLEAEAQMILDRYEFDVDVQTLRLGQIVEIATIMDEARGGANENAVRNDLEIAINRR